MRKRLGFLFLSLLLMLALAVITLQNKTFGMHTELIRRFGTQEMDSPTDISVASSGIYVLGSTAGVFEGQPSFPDDGADDGFLRKYDLEGNVNWTRQFSLAQPLRVSADPSGIYIAGAKLNSTSFELDSLIAKYDLDGNVVWT